eukprot:TRINITY_DN22991_c0_g1_i1.p2 TRINITY_DN22991_c0_g1~~TRINITY_DN22991_c0_g1_i1.p2  ORF type:complete len:113 (-),score=7.56 TRINITY_DN22991_c0_g1_i1:16-354(-)
MSTPLDSTLPPSGVAMLNREGQKEYELQSSRNRKHSPPNAITKNLKPQKQTPEDCPYFRGTPPFQPTLFQGIYFFIFIIYFELQQFFKGVNVLKKQQLRFCLRQKRTYQKMK